MTEPDGKTIEAAAARAAGKVALWASGSLFVAMGTLIVASGSIILSNIHSKIDAAVSNLEEHRKTDVQTLNQRLTDLTERTSDQSNDQRQLRDEQMRRTERIASLEAEQKASLRVITDIGTRMQRVAESLAGIEGHLGLRRRSDRDRPAAEPAPPADLGLRVPMLWRF